MKDIDLSFQTLPKVILKYLKYRRISNNTALKEISKTAKASKRSVLNEIAFENYCYYLVGIHTELSKNFKIS